MALPTEKKEYLKKVGLSDDVILSLDKSLQEGSALASSLGLDSKEEDKDVKEEVADEEVADEVKADADAEEDTEAPTFDEKQTDVLAGYFAALTDNIVKQVGKLVDEKLASVIEELDNEREEKAELLGQTPKGSLMDMILNPQLLKAQAVDQSPDAVVDKRKGLFRNSGPEETEAPMALKGVPTSIEQILGGDPFGKKAQQEA